MVIEAFPDTSTANPSGLLAIGGDLEVDSLLLAYRSGIFPWPVPDYPLAWFAPPRRAILRPEKLHLSRRFYQWATRVLQRGQVEVTCCKSFSSTIRACCNEHAERSGGTWITEQLIDGYIGLFEAGYAYSIEVWDRSSEPATLNRAKSYRESSLVGGLYGVAIDGMVSAESMFHRADNCSKLALLGISSLCRSQEVPWIDLQVLNPFTKSVGAEEISRNKFHALIERASMSPPTISFPDETLNALLLAQRDAAAGDKESNS